MTVKSRARKPPRTSKAESLAEVLPEFAQSFFLILLMWLLAELIFLPLSSESFTEDLAGKVSSIIAAAFIIPIASLFLRAARNGHLAVRLIAGSVANARYTRASRPRMQQIFESLGDALLAGVLGGILSSLLFWLHPVFGGMGLVVTITVAFMFALGSATQASEDMVKRTSG